jgi:23S rRNA A2030 N6-methylase RlmJ
MAVNEFERDVIDRLGRIETKLDNDYRAIHGNGHPGLMDRMARVEQRLTVSELQEKEIQGLITSVIELKAQVTVMQSKAKWYKDWLGWLVATGLAVSGIFWRR